MKSGQCPKCGAGDIRIIALDWQRKVGASIATGLFSAAAVDHHVCVRCGYTEMYVSDPADLESIASKWPAAES
jgi:predicted nucleic-acid-binding Zn-ribbon protein